jgi:hypothetical protein
MSSPGFTIDMPKLKDMVTDFNKFFEGRTLYSDSGTRMDPCGKRQVSAISSKVCRICEALKVRIDEVIDNTAKWSENYRPIITYDMLRDFYHFKVNLGLLEQEAEDEYMSEWVGWLMLLEEEDDVAETNMKTLRANLVKSAAIAKKKYRLEKASAKVAAAKAKAEAANKKDGVVILEDAGAATVATKAPAQTSSAGAKSEEDDEVTI